jgi:hypothetical protein
MQVLIGSIIYDVLYLPDLYGSEGPLCGDINTSRARIRINADDDSQVQVVTLWHEVIHGMLYTAGIREHDEVLVDALAHGLVQVMRDNPEIIPTLDAETRTEGNRTED